MHIMYMYKYIFLKSIYEKFYLGNFLVIGENTLPSPS